MRGRAVVVGGGIGGLAAAIGLRRTGWEVTVVERAPVLADVGAGISLHSNGLRALDALGAGAAVRAAARPVHTGGTRTPDGRWLTRLDGAALARAVGDPIHGITRADLHRLLRETLPADRLHVGTQATGIDLTDPARPRVLFADGALEADLVVAADGVNSRLRAQLLPGHPGPVHSGSTVLRALTDGPLAVPTDFCLTWGPGAEFGHLALADGRAEWFAVLGAPPGTRYADALAAVRERFAGWHDPIPELLAATRPQDVLHHDIHELATPLPTFASGRVALLGDAAHAMTTNLGQGACQALEDAVVLAAALAAEPSVEAALVRYDAERRPRSAGVARAARQAGRMGHQLTHPLAVGLRNTAVRLTPPAVMLRGLLRHADWTPPALT
ncbi:FAD-dependent monooxygenase [Streptomyces sp. NPDC049915]|uniref:FAD-dependent monooxygenase n=1 Tax=Streptomyces sp. NPDC049915 TaxID=3155510 RepID=UPI003425AC99